MIDIDIKGFFDNVNHGKLLRQMWALGIHDKALLSIISLMLKAEIAGIGFPQKGTPQGGIISPLLSNIVLNELDWWITSQWENMPTVKKREYVRLNNGVVDKAQKYEMLREKSKLKECYIVRYADDFKIFCRKRSDAVKLFNAVKDWLKERLGLDISPEKSMIVNLKKRYSMFLGFKLKAVQKGKKSNGKTNYVVESHISDKALKKIKLNAKKFAVATEFTGNTNEAYKAINRYNSYVLGVHNYYRFATHISKDFRKIALGQLRTLENRLRDRLSKKGGEIPLYIEEKYGKSKQLRFIDGMAIIPIAYIQTKAPLYKKREINEYTESGRKAIHKQLETVNMNILRYLMRNPVQNNSVEFNTNRLALYCSQRGKCAITKQNLEVENIHCHHKVPRKFGGKDNYANLTLVTKDVHTLIHATDETTINRLLERLNLDRDKKRKLNTLRKKAELSEIV